MTETEFLASDDPAAMLRLVAENPDHQDINCASDRQLRLFCHAVLTACGLRPFNEGYVVSGLEVREWARRSAAVAEPGSFISNHPEVNRADLLRHIVGNVFRPWNAVACERCAPNPAANSERPLACRCKGEGWLPGPPLPSEKCPKCYGVGESVVSGVGKCSRCHGTGRVTAWPAAVVRLAEAVYGGEDVAFALADSLEEAGQTVLAEHFRREANHPRGCWALDIILGKS